jgi:ligand-binding SRPBCC domain-containing protein
MAPHELEREQWLPASPERVFAFFADAANLERMTPPWLGFRIRTPLPIEMKAGASIDYSIRLGPVPVRWRTRIAVWEPEKRFVDIQERGPYARWVHTHEFTPMGGGVLMADRVSYALPLGPLGELAHAGFVRALLARIFDHRFARARELFASNSPGRALSQE